METHVVTNIAHAEDMGIPPMLLRDKLADSAYGDGGETIDEFFTEDLDECDFIGDDEAMDLH